MTLNIWDFGGQEIMRGTHKFFLTQRSLYLLVLEDRRQDDLSVEPWLATITSLAGDSPILIVINKSDDGQHNLELDEPRLKRDWPNVVEVQPNVVVMRTSCIEGVHAQTTIEDLKTALLELIDHHPQLNHVRDPIPTAWRRVKDALGALARQRKVLPHEEYIRLCRGADGAEAITDPNEQRVLLQLLHDLGVVVAYGLGRSAPAAAREITLLDPNWLTGAIYEILNSELLRDQGGEFARRQLGELLNTEHYPEEWWEFILWMMQLDAVGLCFQIPGRGDRYLVPEALPKNQPFYENWPGSLRFCYEYAYLPPGLVPRLIVEANTKLVNPPTRWRMGAVFKVADCPVLVYGEAKHNRVEILVDGPAGQRRSALNVILADLDRVHDFNVETKPKALVRLPAEPEITVSYTHLRKMEEVYGPTHRFLPDGASREYEVRELLDGVRRDEYRDDRRYPDSASQHVHIYPRGGEVTIKNVNTQITGGQIQGLAIDASQATVSNSSQSGSSSTPREDIDRDQFERDVIEILTRLTDAQDRLDAQYEPLRAALRKLNKLELEQTAKLDQLRAEFDALLTQQDKGALKRLAEASGDIGTNLLASGLWSYLIDPLIRVVV